ncbi:hypothetical protein SFRURICE_002307 [Spodoptera frugiperda]|nr:hypothetical protein SFRURICE_002307 [Spodoptera frugiperda]
MLSAYSRICLTRNSTSFKPSKRLIFMSSIPRQSPRSVSNNNNLWITQRVAPYGNRTCYTLRGSRAVKSNHKYDVSLTSLERVLSQTSNNVLNECLVTGTSTAISFATQVPAQSAAHSHRVTATHLILTQDVLLNITLATTYTTQITCLLVVPNISDSIMNRIQAPSVTIHVKHHPRINKPTHGAPSDTLTNRYAELDASSTTR